MSLKVKIRRSAVAAAAGAVLACSARPRPVPPFEAATALPALPVAAIAAETAHVDTVAPGVVLHRLWVGEGPWAIRILDVDRDRCWSAAAVKPGGRAVGRAGAVELARQAEAGRGSVVAGAVNADFFSFTPPGVPASGHVERGRMLVSPAPGRPLFIVDDTRVRIGELALEATVNGVPIDAWNRPLRRGVAVLDDRFGGVTDTATGAIEIRLRRPGEPSSAAGIAGAGAIMLGVVETVDTTSAGAAVPTGTFLVTAGPAAASARRAALDRWRPGDTIRISAAVRPMLPREAVGGLPRLVRDGAVDPGIDTAGSPGFRGRHPRTAVAIAASGRRLLLVTVDGRQPGYSAGMTLLELAQLMITLGAGQALNLDGGGSTTMVVRDSSAAGGFRIVNSPSDPAGERPVGNALAIVRGC